ncbi:MAG: peptide-methionine (S)-S-oxide reductase [Gammaproteobacteria bacterium]|nr:peptide-methionine (S)-S-oxide reductase [Gammaproteobacteria bacterium]|tara:strand:- start:544 stop:999 length:456 start_codon:yes stop_codon:yes gene_type:complete
MTNTAIFAAGCFWGVEEKFRNLPGVIKTEVGYIGGITKNPTYEDVCTGDTNHAEAVKVIYDNNISYKELVDFFFKIHNPTTPNQQGVDFGTQYRSAVFYSDEKQKNIIDERIKYFNENLYNNSIVTTIELATEFWIAEEYHQKYILKKKTG